MLYSLARLISTAAVLVSINTPAFGQQTPPVDNDLPVVRHFVAPEYPISAWFAQIQGSVVTELMIKQDGTVDSASVVSGLPIFRNSIETALKGWTFRVPGSTRIDITTEFKLDGNCPWTASQVGDKRHRHSRIETQVFADFPSKVEIKTCAPTIETTVSQSEHR